MYNFWLGRFLSGCSGPQARNAKSSIRTARTFVGEARSGCKGLGEALQSLEMSPRLLLQRNVDRIDGFRRSLVNMKRRRRTYSR
jgi:hypothetical protein